MSLIEVELLFTPDLKSEIYHSALESLSDADKYTIEKNRGPESAISPEIGFTRDGFMINLSISGELAGYEDGTVATFDVTAAQIDDATDVPSNEAIHHLIASVEHTYSSIDQEPLMGYASEPIEIGPRAPVPEGQSPPCKRQFLTWFDIYHPAEVKEIGRETLLSAPAPIIHELDDGGIAIIAKNPHTMDGMDELGDHLGIPPWYHSPVF